MIKVKITKNIIRKTKNSLGITPKQILIGCTAALIGVILYFSLRNVMHTEVLMTLIFVVLAAIIGFGCIDVQGQTLLTYLIKIFKGADVRPYESKGVFSQHAGLSDKKEI